MTRANTPEEADAQYGKVIWEDTEWRLRVHKISSTLVIVAHQKSADGKREELPRGYLLGSNILQLECSRAGLPRPRNRRTL
jgi:hypothetical protein